MTKPFFLTKKNYHSALWEKVTIFILKLFIILKKLPAFWLNVTLQERKSSQFLILSKLSKKYLRNCLCYLQCIGKHTKPCSPFCYLLKDIQTNVASLTLAQCILTWIFNSHLCYLKFNNHFSHILFPTQKRGFKFERVLWFVQEHSSLLHAVPIWGLSLLPAIKRLLKNQKPVKYYSLSKKQKENTHFDLEIHLRPGTPACWWQLPLHKSIMFFLYGYMNLVSVSIKVYSSIWQDAELKNKPEVPAGFQVK